MKINHKYINSITPEVAEIRIYKRIGAQYGEDGVNGSDFANEMDYLNNYSGAKKINVRINSGGGSVLEGYAIVSSILNSKIPVHTYIDGIAASMAAVIAVSGKKVYMADYGVFMIHNAMGGGDNQKDMEITSLFTKTLNTILTNRTGKTTEEISAMMEVETWMDSAECKRHGFIDEIVDCNKKISKPKLTASLEECYSIFNEILTKPKQNMKQITASLKLAESASENEIVNAISSKDTLIATLQNEINDFKAKALEVENANKEALKLKATTLVNKSKEDGKITEAEVAELIENASSSESNFSFVEKMLNKVSVIKPAVKVITNGANQAVGDERSTWTWTNWSQKDPAGLLKMKNESPALYENLYNKEFKK